ncbi:MAG: HEAT repeat domain-containing protein [Candidatus Heimdallarchaeum aukensis]|uniref:HEAT repeat domain-containing protein n=1 Tax=Candidatus Heimdallarchaeum aukensis TaxID=2876573 RepID=A0A9Y1BJ89_9ARCH|nr:MAG: HEAT repeat domain-containing protein [Candidatus Heimdallarchaeum aukensis]
MSMNNDNVTKLINTLKDKNQILALRLLAIEQLAEKPEVEESIQALLGALSDDKQEIRAYAAEMLGKMGSKKALFPLIDSLHDLSYEVRVSALRSLALLKDEQAIEHIAKRILDQSDKVRYEAVKALASFDSIQIIKPLFEALSDENEAVKNKAERVLLGLKLSDKISEELVISFLKHTNPFIRDVATRFITFRLIGSAVPLLVKQTYDKNWEVKLSALQELNKIVAVKAENREQIIECCLKCLDDNNPKIKMESIDILRELKAEEAINKLIIISTKDPDERVRFEAIDAITEIRRAKRLTTE